MRLPLWDERRIPLWDGEIGQEAPSLTPYLCDREKPKGAVIVCPGGAYAFKAEHEGEPVAKLLGAGGWHAFVLDYRVAPYRAPAALQDVLRAVRLVRHRAEQWDIAGKPVAILGFSAGGHLAGCAGMMYNEAQLDAADPVDRVDSRPDGVVLCYPVVSFLKAMHVGSRSNLLGESGGPNLWKRWSLETRVHPAMPPAFIWHTAEDCSVPVQNSLMLGDALAKANVAYELHVFAHGPHGLGATEEALQNTDWMNLCLRWLGRLQAS